MPRHKKLAISSMKTPVSGVVSAAVSIERHLRLSEAAARLGVSRATMYRWLRKIEHYSIPCGGIEKTLILIPESALLAFLKPHKRVPDKDS